MGTALCRLLLSCGCLLLSVCGADPDDVKKAREEMGSADPSSLLAGMLGGGQPSADDSDDDSDDD